MTSEDTINKIGPWLEKNGYTFFNQQPKKNNRKIEARKIYDAYMKATLDDDMAPGQFLSAISEILNLNYDSTPAITSSIISPEELNTYTANDVLWWLRIAILEDGSWKVVVRTNPDTNTYTMVLREGVENIIKTLGSQHSRLVEEAGDSLIEGFKEKRISFANNYIKESNGDTFIKIPTLLSYLNDNWGEILFSKRMILQDRIINFSNNMDQCAFAHVDVDTISYRGDAMKHKPTPTIDSWLNSMFYPDQRGVFAAYLHGVLRDDFRSRQGMYIEDLNGNSGKSTFIEAFMDYLSSIDKNLVAAMTSKNMSSQFVYAQFHGKRVVVDADVKNHLILASEVYHKMTGGDTVSIEMKGQDVFSAKIKCFPIMMGNISLDINTAYAHERSRIIYLKARRLDEKYLKTQCDVDDKGDLVRDIFGSTRFRKDTNFKEKIIKEMPSFIQKSEEWYDKLSGGAEIRLSDKILHDLENIASSEEVQIYEDIVHNELDFKGDDDSVYPILDMKEDLQEYFDGRNKEFAWKDFIKYLEVTHGASKRRKKLANGHRCLCMIGVKRKKS